MVVVACWIVSISVFSIFKSEALVVLNSVVGFSSLNVMHITLVVVAYLLSEISIRAYLWIFVTPLFGRFCYIPYQYRALAAYVSHNGVPSILVNTGHVTSINIAREKVL